MEGEWQMLGLYVRGSGFGLCCGSGWRMCESLKVMHCRMCLVIMVLWKWAVWQR